MLVAGVQTGHMRGASARIRYFTFMKHLKCYKTVNLNKADVIYFQKKSSKDIIKLARELKTAGKKIVFDCDDGDGDRDRVDRNDPAMFKIADAITTDTEERADVFRKRTDTPVYVVQDCIDYGISRSNKIEINHEVKTIGTFGTHKVLEATYKNIKKVPDLERYYICDRKIPKYDKAGWEFSQWNLDTFVDNLKRFDICVLLHPENKLGELKSNNRLLVCMALGIPTIVSHTQSYSKTMCDVGLPFSMVEFGIKDAFDFLSSYHRRNSWSNTIHEYVWKRYSPEESARQLEYVFRRVYDSSI